jgi:hypothetical protein
LSPAALPLTVQTAVAESAPVGHFATVMSLRMSVCRKPAKPDGVGSMVPAQGGPRTIGVVAVTTVEQVSGAVPFMLMVVEKTLPAEIAPL